MRIRISSPLGVLELTASDAGLAGLRFEGTEHPPRERGAAPEAPGAGEVLRRAQAQLEEYFASRRRDFDLPLDLRGTPFQVRVWSALREIPYGSTMSYGALAKCIGAPAAVRAVGAANGRNPVAIIVPCHRVIGANGDLTGFGGGIERKRWLLRHESGSPELPLGR